MSTPGERLTLEAFLERVAPKVQSDSASDVASIHGIADHLSAHLNDVPDLKAQVFRFRATIPDQIAEVGEDERAEAIVEARTLLADIKQRWIEADDAPLVDEIDEHLDALSKALARLRSPGPRLLQEAAARIDQLAYKSSALDGIESKYAPWAIASAVLFLIGLVRFLWPTLLDGLPFMSSFWAVLFCLAALPAVAAHYAWTVKPRTIADTEIETLNREHFLPLGGLYFPVGKGPACVVTVAQAAPKDERTQALEERQGHKDRARKGW